MKKIISLLTASIMIFSTACTAKAPDAPASTTTKLDIASEQPKESVAPCSKR